MHNQSKKQATRSSRQRRQSNSSSSGSVPEMRVPSLPSTSAATLMPADSSFPTFSYPPPPLPSESSRNRPSLSIESAAPPFLSFPPPHTSPSLSRHPASPLSNRRAFAPDPAAQFSYPPPGMPAGGYSAPNAEFGSIAPSVPWFPPRESYHRSLSDTRHLAPVASTSAGFGSSSTQAYHPQHNNREDSWSSSDDEDDEDDDAWYASHYAVDPSRLSEPSGSTFDARGSEPPSSSPASTSRLSRSRTPLVIETIPSREQLTEEREMRRRQSRSAKMHACRICGKAFPRRSGLETHMNTHSGVRPYDCPFPGCEKLFNVLSNARRHHNTHFYQPPPPRPPEPMEFRFAEPIVEGAPAPSPATDSQTPFNVRWMDHNVAARGQSTGRRKKKSGAGEDTEAPEAEGPSKHPRGPHPRDPEDRARPS